MILLHDNDMEAVLDPLNGATIARATWRGHHFLRPQNSTGDVLASSCFPLVPFSNRVANSAFCWDDDEIVLQPNHPGDAGSPAIHGLGWLRPWEIDHATDQEARLVLEHDGGTGWPFRFRVFHDFQVSGNRLELALSYTNLEERSVPAGLGFHPYFHLGEDTVFRGQHRGEWQTDHHCIPTQLLDAGRPVDWWDGQPVATRNVDTVYTGREGSMHIEWPDRQLGLKIEPSEDLSFTTIYVPAGGDFFCVEPVSHMTDAFNRSGTDTGMRILEPGESWTVSVLLRPYAL